MIAEDIKVSDPTEEDRKLIQTYLEELRDDADLMQDQREKAAQDMSFVDVSGGMWQDLFDGESPNRTLMELDLISPYIQRFIAEYNLNRVGVEFKPDDEATTDDDANLMNGVFRADYRDNSGKEAVDNAVDEVAKCGYGCWKLGAALEDDEDPRNDKQRIEFRPMNEAYNHVIWHGSAKRINKMDAKRCVVLHPFIKKSFEKTHPGFTASSVYDPQVFNYSDYRDLTANEMYIATRYEIVQKKEKVFVYHNFITEELEVYDREQHEAVKDELAADDTKRFYQVRTIKRRRVFKSVFTADAFIERPHRIAGKYIPIIPVYAHRSYVRGSEWYRGLVRKLIDAQRIFNFVISKLAEVSASSGQKTPIVTAEQIEGFEGVWADRTNAAYLPLNLVRDESGNIIQSGPVGYLEPSSLDQNTEALMRIILDVLKEVTGAQPMEIKDPNMSGKALQQVFKRISMNTQEIQDNIANAVEWCGKVYQAMAEEVYNTPRMIRTIGFDGTHGVKRLHSVVMDEETGRLVEANKISGKKFRVYSDIGPQYETQREESIETLKGLGEMVKGSSLEGQYLQPIFSMMIQNLNGVGIGPLKEMNRRFLLAQGLVKPETDEEKQLVAQLQQPQQNPQDDLVKAATQQALGEAERAKAEARNLDAKSMDNIASAEKKAAETREILAKTENEKAKTIFEIRKQILEGTKALPF